MDEAPRIPWLEGRTIHLPDGTTIRAERSYTYVHLVGSDVLALWNDDDTGLKELDELDGGRQRRGLDAHGRPGGRQ